MGSFRYSAVDNSARVVHGHLEAADDKAVVGWLRERGYYPIQVRTQNGDGAPTAAGPLGFLARWPTRHDVLVFTQQFHTLVAAGLEVDRSLAILGELAENTRMRWVIRRFLSDVQRGVSVADGLAAHPRVFSKLYINMVKAGEAGGALDVVLGRLAALLESTKAIRDEVLSALLYPALVIGVGGGAVAVLLGFVMPRFAAIFAESGQLLPLPTRALLAVSSVTATYWWAILASGILLGALARASVRTQRGRLAWDRVTLRLPVLGLVIRELEVARFARTLGSLLQSGVPVLTALGIVTETVGNTVIARALPRLKDGAKRGEGIAGPLKATEAFPPMAIHMAKVGEETGRLEEMLLKVADTYDARVKTSIRRLLSLLEPILILLLGVIVGSVVLSMLLAILSISDLPI
jgi:general secretion pathway protein F